MKILSKLFGKKKRGNVSTGTQHVSDETYNQVASFIDNIDNMDDCGLASKMLDELGKSFPELRNRLCDKTFETFAIWVKMK
jgi:hypothetical protein